MKTFIYLLIFQLFFPFLLIADDKKDVEDLLKSKLDAVVSVLQDKTIPHEGKKDTLIKTVESMFDFKLMAKLTLGKKVWLSLEKEKKEKFIELFVRKLKNTYVDKLKVYNNEKIIFKEITQIKKNKIHIHTDILSSETSHTILYKFYKSKQEWKIYDVEVQGVSIVSSYRNQSKHILAKGTIDDLISSLEKPENE